MKRYIQRLAFAFFISAGAFAGTHFWYQSVSNNKDARKSNSNPIAKLSNSVNEVQRKQLARVIWEEISLNDELYPGEAIRTSSSSQAKIQFLETGTEIDLEPDSLIVLEKHQDGIALDFLKGNLYVSKSSNRSGQLSTVKLKSGNNEINLNDAELSLSRTESGQVDLEVFKGSAELSQNGKSTTIDQSKAGTLSNNGLSIDENRLQLISPLPGEPVFIDPRKKEGVSFAWKAVAKDYDIFIEKGKKRSLLFRTEKRTATGDKGILKIQSKVGRFFFRAVAVPRNPDLPELRSKVFPIQVKAKTPPVVLSPEKDENLVLKGDKKTLKVRWVAKNQFDQLALEIAEDPALKKIVLSEPLDSKLQFAEVAFTRSGSFYLRLTGYIKIKGDLEPISSPVIPFTSQLGANLIPPILKSPAPEQRLTFQQVSENGLFISWQPVPGIQKYKLLIVDSKNKKVVDKEILTNPLRLNEIKPGSYRWALRSVAETGKASKFSEKRSFSVEEMPLIKWVGGSDPSPYGYVTAEPTLMARWQQNVKGVSSWRVRVVPEGQLAKETEWQNVTEPVFGSVLPKDGDYALEVEGLSTKGTAIARSSKKIFRVAQRQLLPPPQFSRDLPEQLKASRSGSFQLDWLKVNGAKRYKLLLLSDDGSQVINEKVIQRNTASLRKMRPGQYKISVKAIDEYERDGEPTRPRSLEVPTKSAIKAPMIKSIKVK